MKNIIIFVANCNVMIDKEQHISVRECKECKHYLGGSTCRAFDAIPIELFLNAAQHDAVRAGQTGKYIFESAKEPEILHVYSAK